MKRITNDKVRDPVEMLRDFMNSPDFNPIPRPIDEGNTVEKQIKKAPKQTSALLEKSKEPKIRKFKYTSQNQHYASYHLKINESGHVLGVYFWHHPRTSSGKSKKFYIPITSYECSMREYNDYQDNDSEHSVACIRNLMLGKIHKKVGNDVGAGHYAKYFGMNFQEIHAFIVSCLSGFHKQEYFKHSKK